MASDPAGGRWAARALALSAGAVVPLGFAPPGLWPLVLLGPAVLVVLCHGAARGRAFGLGWFFGFALFLAGVPWVYVSIHEFGHAWAPMAALVTVGLAAVLGLFTATAAALAAAVGARGGWFCLGVFPAAWVLMEWVRSWFLTGFPWLNLGAAHTDSWLAGFGPVLGVYGMSLASMVVAGALALAWLARPRYRGLLPALVLAFVLFPVGWALGRVAWTQPDGQPLSAALLQGNFGQDVKWEREWLRPQLEWYARRTRDNLDADVVLWPETALPAFYHQLRVPYFSDLDDAARESGTAVIAGTLFAEGDRAFNSMVGLGTASGVYHKIHLVPLGEYFPLKGLVRFLMPGLDIPMNDLSAGSVDQPPLRIGDRPAAPTICYEDAFGELTRRLLPEAGLLVSVSNDAWFGDSFAPHQHLQIARVRALEAGRPMLRATNTGVSAVIGHDGELRSTLAQFEQDVLRGEVMPRRGATPFALLGYWPVLASCLALLVGAAVTGAGAARRGDAASPESAL